MLHYYSSSNTDTKFPWLINWQNTWHKFILHKLKQSFSPFLLFSFQWMRMKWIHSNLRSHSPFSFQQMIMKMDSFQWIESIHSALFMPIFIPRNENGMDQLHSHSSSCPIHQFISPTKKEKTKMRQKMWVSICQIKIMKKELNWQIQSSNFRIWSSNYRIQWLNSTEIRLPFCKIFLLTKLDKNNAWTQKKKKINF